MTLDRKRTLAHCATCGKNFSLQTTDYKKRIAANIDGKIYCSHACVWEKLRVPV